jgi:GTPase
MSKNPKDFKYEFEKPTENAVLIGVITPKNTEAQITEYLEELAFLVETAGGVAQKFFTQKLLKADSRTYVGSGKLEEIIMYIKDNNINLAVFDDELSPSQLRNLEKELGIKVLDRSALILDIFANRAQTAQAKTQVELAQSQYLLPRLTRLWTHLERQKGGIGMRGPGETQIETDRRIILNKISLLKERLKEIDKQNAVQRKNRSGLVRVALVGYTNVGKSTIMNLLSKSDVFAENKLFATLDTTVRKIVIENLPFLISDTVGFIRKLPHHLVECFKSTLDEVRESDLLVHVVDISHPNFEEHIQVVNQTLKDLGAIDKDMIMVFNKIDKALLENFKEVGSLEDFKNTWVAKENLSAVFISATEKENIQLLKNILYEKAKILHINRYPYDNLLYQLPEINKENGEQSSN